jgi:hypothetical protein
MTLPAINSFHIVLMLLAFGIGYCFGEHNERKRCAVVIAHLRRSVMHWRGKAERRELSA